MGNKKKKVTKEKELPRDIFKILSVILCVILSVILS